MKVLYIISGSDYGDPEQKIYHLVSRLKETLDLEITVGFLYDNYLKNLVQSLNVPFVVFGGYPGLVRFFQTHHVDIVHFYSSKRLLQILNQHTPSYTRIIETVFNDGMVGDSTTLGDRSRIDYTIFDSLSAQQSLWPSTTGAIYQPYGINLALLKMDDINLLKAKYKIASGTKSIGIVAKSSEEININLILELAATFRRSKNPFKIILFYTGPAKSVLLNRTISLGLESCLYVDSTGPTSIGFLDILIDLSDGQELRVSTLEALCYRIPVITKASLDSKALMESKKVGFLYENLSTGLELIQKYCIAAINMNRAQISLPATYHVDVTVGKIMEVYKATAETIVDTKKVFNDKTYYVIPYSIYGGAEVYLRNHIKQGTFTNVCLLFLGPNNLYNELKDQVECVILTNLTELGNYLLAKTARKVCFYNSANVYRLLARVKKLSPLYITEIVHSYHSWSDSMHNTDRQMVDEVIVVAVTVAKQWGISKFKVIPPVIDESRFKIPKVKMDKPTIGVVARFSPEKNLKRVLQLAQLMPDYQFVLVGKDGGSKKELEGYIAQHGLSSRVALKDYTDTVEKEYATFDLFLLTSLVEGTPLTILEALAADLPVVAPNVGAIKEMLKNKNAYVFEPNEPDLHIASRIKKMISAKRSDIQMSTIQNIPDLTPYTIAIISDVDEMLFFHTAEVMAEMLQLVEKKTIIINKQKNAQYSIQLKTLLENKNLEYVILYRTLNIPQEVKLLKNKGISVGYAIDDNIFYQEKDNLVPEFIKKGVREGISFADFCLANNETLATEVRKLNKNCICTGPYPIWPAIFTKKNIPLPQSNDTKTIRIGVISGLGHSSQLPKTIQTVVSALQNIPDITIVYFFNKPLPAISSVDLEFHPYSLKGPTEWYTLLHSLKLDIGFVQYEDNIVIRSKSNLKFRETAMMQIPLVAVDPTGLIYQNDIKNGINGYSLTNPTEAVEILRNLVSDRLVIRSMGLRAYETLMNYDPKQIANNLIAEISKYKSSK